MKFLENGSRPQPPTSRGGNATSSKEPRAGNTVWQERERKKMQKRESKREREIRNLLKRGREVVPNFVEGADGRPHSVAKEKRGNHEGKREGGEE